MIIILYVISKRRIILCCNSQSICISYQMQLILFRCNSMAWLQNTLFTFINSVYALTYTTL